MVALNCLPVIQLLSLEIKEMQEDDVILFISDFRCSTWSILIELLNYDPYPQPKRRADLGTQGPAQALLRTYCT